MPSLQSETKQTVPSKVRKTCITLQTMILRRRLSIKEALCKKQSFALSFLITFVLSLGLTIALVGIQIDNKWSTSESLNNIYFEFYECAKLSAGFFLAVKLIETLIPTIITFSGTILMLQANHAEKQNITVWLFLCIALLAAGGIALSTAKTSFFLNIYFLILGLLCMLSVILSWFVFSDDDPKPLIHKKEPCDGRIVF